MQFIRLMAEILHQLIGSLSHYLQGFIHPRWCRISAINSRVIKIDCLFSNIVPMFCFLLVLCRNVKNILWLCYEMIKSYISPSKKFPTKKEQHKTNQNDLHPHPLKFFLFGTWCDLQLTLAYLVSLPTDVNYRSLASTNLDICVRRQVNDAWGYDYSRICLLLSCASNLAPKQITGVSVAWWKEKYRTVTFWMEDGHIFLNGYNSI